MVRFGTVDFNFKKKEAGETIEEFSFSTTVNVDKSGEFSTTVPQDAVRFLEDRQIYVNINRSGNKGYYCADSLENLRKQIAKDFDEAVSSELVEEKIVILYGVETNISYCKNSAGDPVPNATKFWTGRTEDNYQWFNGNQHDFQSGQQPINMSIWFNIRKKMVYRLRSGKVYTKYESIKDLVDSSNNLVMKYLNDILCGNSGSFFRQRDRKEIEYSDEVALVFIGIFKGFARAIEQLNLLSNPEEVKVIAESGMKFLGERNEH